MRKSLLVVTLAAMVAFTSVGAFADSLSFSLNVANPGGLAPTNSTYGTIKLTLVDSTHISFDVQGFNGVPTGSPTSTDYKISDFGFNTRAGFVGTLTCSGVSAGWTNNCSDSGNLDGMGSYGFIVDGPNGSNAPGDHLTFTVTVAGGTFSSVTDLVGSTTGGNCTGCKFAAEVFPFQNGNVLTSTGFAGANGPGTSTPEPAALGLLASGLLALGGLVRRRK